MEKCFETDVGDSLKHYMRPAPYNEVHLSYSDVMKKAGRVSFCGAIDGLLPFVRTSFRATSGFLLITFNKRLYGNTCNSNPFIPFGIFARRRLMSQISID